jgi:geranylgeranyl diphosphate synthase type II
VTGSETEIGKPVGSDERNGKKTYLSYLGFDAAEKKQEELSAEAAALVRSIYETEDGERREAGEFLEGLIESLVKRRK